MRNSMIALSLILAAGSARAADWTMWGGVPARTMVNLNEKNIAAEWDVSERKNIKWSAALGSQSYGNPVIHEGKVYVGTNNGAARDPNFTDDKGIVMCFRESDGEFLWQAIHDKLDAGRVNDWPEQGVCSSPAAEGNRIWYVSNRCEVICADTEGFMDGENDGPVTDEKYSGPQHADIIWKLDMMDVLGVFPHNLAVCSPIIVGDKLFLVTGNGVDEGHLFIPSPRAPSFICVDKNDGKVLWENKLPGKKILHGQWSNPAYAVINGRPQVICPGGDGWVYSLNPENGEMLWKFDCNPKDSVWTLGGRGTRNNLIATPVIVNDRVYIGVGQDPEHGEGPGHFYAIDATGEGDVTETANIWQFDELGRTMSTAAVHEGLVYISDLAGFLYCLDETTGEKLWEYDTLAALWSSPTIIDGRLYLGDEDGDVVILALGRELKELGEYTMENSVYTTPVAANGVLYIANRSELFAIAK